MWKISHISTFLHTHISTFHINMFRQIQQRIIHSKTVFPVSVVFSLILWVLSMDTTVAPTVALGQGIFWEEIPMWVIESLNLSLFVLTIYLFIELNNAFSIVGRRSVLPVSFLLLFWGGAPFFNHSVSANAVLFLMVLAAYILFCSYQMHDSVGHAFLLFVCLGVSSLLHPQVLWFIPLFYAYLYIYQVLSVRSFLAAFLGILFPYWLLFVYAFWTRQLPLFYASWMAMFDLQPIDYSVVPYTAWATLSFASLLLMVSAVHFVRNDFLDKIRTRAFLNSLISLAGFSLIIFFLQPQHYVFLSSFVLISSSILCSHFFSLTESRSSNIFFIAVVVVLFLLSFCNIWMPSYNFF